MTITFSLLKRFNIEDKHEICTPHLYPYIIIINAGDSGPHPLASYHREVTALDVFIYTQRRLEIYSGVYHKIPTMGSRE